VVGDGRSTIDELIDLPDQLRPAPRRRRGVPARHHPLADNPVARLEVARQGFTPGLGPPAGAKVLIVRSGNHTDDVTDLVHPETAATAALAARIVGLDIAGVDLVCEDISRPLDEQRGAIVEVNAGPGLLMHLKPANGQPRPVGAPSSTSLFPEWRRRSHPRGRHHRQLRQDHRCPPDRRLLALSGRHTGLACSAACSSTAPHRPGDSANWGGQPHPDESLRRRRGLRERQRHHPREGLAYDRCQVGIVTNVEPKRHFGATTSTRPNRYSPSCARRSTGAADGAAVLNAASRMLVEWRPCATAK
jgi:cyanophycin synthetase